MRKQETLYCRMNLNKITLRHLQELADSRNLLWVASRKQILKMRKK